MNSGIKPIETVYNNYRFRSRTEARWTVFFDHAKIAYSYEVEGFQMGKVRYLPDFQLKQGIRLLGEGEHRKQVWVEIKPSLQLEEDDRQKIAQFVQNSSYQVILIGGEPAADTELRLIYFDQAQKKLAAPFVRWTELEDGQIGLVSLDYLKNLAGAEMQSAINNLTGSPKLNEAYRQARQARFEYQQQCRSCGKSFTTLQSNYQYCENCYKTRFVQNNQPAQKNSKWWVVGGVILLLLLVGGYIFTRPNQVSPITPTPVPTESDPTQPPPTQTPLPTQTPIIPTAESQATPLPEAEPTPVCSCQANQYDCSDFSTQNEAQACFDFCMPSSGDVHFLDSNQDRQACESLPNE